MAKLIYLNRCRYISLGAAAIGGAAISTGGSIISGPLTAYLQHKYAAEDRAENYRYNEMAAANADARERAQWRDMYSMEAQMHQIQENGLSPSLMFSGGVPGTQGAAGHQGQGAAGPSTGSLSPLLDMSAFSSLGSQMASAKQAESQSRLNNAEADALEGKNASGAAAIAKDLAEAGYKNASAAYMDIDTELNKIELALKTDNYEQLSGMIKAQEKILSFNAQKIHAEANSADLNFEFQNETYQLHKQELTERVNNIIADTYLKYWQSALADSNIKLNTTQMAYLRNMCKYYMGMLSVEIRKTNIMKQSVDDQWNFMQKKIEMFNSEIDVKLRELDQDWQKFSSKLEFEKGKFGVETLRDIIGNVVKLIDPFE